MLKLVLCTQGDTNTLLYVFFLVKTSTLNPEAEVKKVNQVLRHPTLDGPRKQGSGRKSLRLDRALNFCRPCDCLITSL